MRRILIRALAGASALALGAHAASAQSTSNGQSTDVGEVVVTGTLIHGKVPTGNEVTTISAADVAELGVVDTSQILSSVPLDGSFNSVPQVGAYGPHQTINAPVLRNLGGLAGPSSATLLLLDGVRLPGMGVASTGADMDVVAPGALAGVDIVPDGGSATYGADAVGGVVNMNTRRRFDGLEMSGHYGGADAYDQWDLGVTAGKTWDKVSAWFSYDYSQHSLIYNNDRSYEHNLNYATTPPTGINQTCSPGNFVVGSNTYPLVNGVPTVGPANTCDNSKSGTFYPGGDRHALMAGVDYDIASWLTFDLRGYYMRRDATSDVGAADDTYSVTANNPVAPFQSGSAEGLFTQAPLNHSYSDLSTQAWGVIPRLKAQLGADWHMDAFVNVAEGYSRYDGQVSNATVVTNAAATGAFNPFTGLFSNNAAGQAAINYLANNEQYQSGKDDILNSRIVFDGPVFSLPGGAVRVAVGGEFIHEQFTTLNFTGVPETINTTSPASDSRVVWAGFGELNVPIVSEDNHVPLIDSLTFSAAGRYDAYSDFGNTFNPKLGVNWKPVSWWTFRGDWGTSFQAPSLASSASVQPPTLNIFPASLFGLNPAFPNGANKFTLLLFPGGGINLQPQKATTWEIGTDIRPPFIPGLSASTTYYNIDFTNQIGIPAFYTAQFYNLYPSSYVMNSPSAPLTSAQIQKFVNQAVNGPTAGSTYVANPSEVYSLESALTQNLGALTTSGLDFNLNYTHPTGFGSVFGGISGNYLLTFESKKTSASPDTGIDANSVTRLHMQTNIGATVDDVFGGKLLARATWNMSGEYSVLPDAGNLFQPKIAPFNIINLALVYTPKVAGGPLTGTTFSLNVNNLLDTNPPYYNGSNGAGNGYAGFTLGRFIQFGATKKF